MAFPLPDKPSIAVLPFTNMSGNPEQDYFADGMTDDLITDLSKVGGLFVIARNSTFVYKGRAVEIRQVAEDLGVRYVVEGSIRRADDTVRVNAQLIDATTGGHVWAERYDGEVDNIFAVQDDFVHKIVSALKITLVPQEDREIGRGQTDELVARESFQKGWELALRFNATDNAKAIPHLKQAIALDPNYGRAHAALTLAYLRATYLYWSTPLGMSREAAFYTGRETLKVAKENPTALLHVASTLFLLLDGPQEEAVAEAARAIELDPNEPEGHVVMAWALLTEGRTDEALQSIERAMRLNPNYPSHYVWTRGVAYFAEGEFERAATIFESQLEADPQAQELAALLASAYGILGRREEARAALKVWKPSWSPQTNITSVANFGLRFLRNSRFERVRERMYDGIYIAALPLEVTVSGLVESLEDENLFERLNALDVLSRFGPMAAPAIPALLIALDDEQELVRRRAIHALGKIGPAAIDAIPALEKLQGDRSVLGLEAKDAVRRILGT
jgi:TolB-like protein/Tfp pilus assembly protein PilF